MSTLSTLNYKYIGKFSIGTSNSQNLLGTLGTAFASNTYADGSSRSFGTGSAWSSTMIMSSSGGSFVTTAVSLAPVSSSLSQRIMYAGGQTVTPSPAPTMLGSDAYSTGNNRVFFGLAKNTVDGTIVNWSNSNPYSSGSFTGYLGFATSTSVTHIHVYESQETVMIVAELTNNTVQISLAGALLDPETTTAGNSEVDGKIYGVFSSGYLGPATIINGGNVGTQTFLFYGGVTAGYAKSYIFNFGLNSTSLTTSKSLAPSNTSTLKNTTGEYIRQQIYMEVANGGNFYGRLREITMFPTSLGFTKFTISNAVNGYIIGAASNAASNCLLLKA